MAGRRVKANVLVGRKRNILEIVKNRKELKRAIGTYGPEAVKKAITVEIIDLEKRANQIEKKRKETVEEFKDLIPRDKQLVAAIDELTSQGKRLGPQEMAFKEQAISRGRKGWDLLMKKRELLERKKSLEQQLKEL